MANQFKTESVYVPAADGLSTNTSREPRVSTLGFAVLSLALLMATHLLVDTIATTVNPLWPSLETHLSTGRVTILWIFVIWTCTTSFSQFAFGYFADRVHGRWMLWLGPAVAVVCLSSIGLTTSPLVLAVLLVLGGLGVAAFHPEAAATAGGYAPAHRSRAMSIFALGGYFGQAVGPTYSGLVTDRIGFPGLALGIPIGLTILLFLVLAFRRADQVPVQQRRETISLLNLLRGKKRGVALLLLIGMLRVTAALGVPLAMAYLLKQRAATNAEVGLVQSSFLTGIGVGSLLCALFVRHEHERRVLWFIPLLIAVPLLVLPSATGLLLFIVVAASGLFIGITLPVLISYGQQLLPEGQRVASSLTMGVTWGFGGAAVALLMHAADQWWPLQATFYIFAAASIVSSALSFWLPVVPARLKPA